MVASSIRPQRLVCWYSFTDGGRPVLDSLSVESDSQSCQLNFSWSWAAKATLRDDLVDYLTSLVGRCFPNHQGESSQIDIPNFLGRLPGLRFETLSGERHSDDTGKIELLLTVGDVPSLMHMMTDKKMHDPVEDVFLPLSNLSSYLRTMTDQSADASCHRATHATADRIDEFLLIYGGRLQDTRDAADRSSAI